MIDTAEQLALDGRARDAAESIRRLLTDPAALDVLLAMDPTALEGFDVIRAGELPDGTPYRVVRRRRDGWTRAFVGDKHDGRGARRSLNWLRQQLRAATVAKEAQ